MHSVLFRNHLQDRSQVSFAFPFFSHFTSLTPYSRRRNSDYTAEHGALRNFEPWRDNAEDAEEDKLARMEEEENNPMAALENKSVDSKREMDILDALQELKTRNARMERAAKSGDAARGLTATEGVSSAVEVGDRGIVKKIDELEERRRKEEEADEEEVKKIFGRAYVSGVPDIEMDDPSLSPASSSHSSGNDEASGSGSTPVATSIKRKLEAVEPTPAELLSAGLRSIVGGGAKVGGVMGPPAKKKGKGKGNDLANKLGIRLKK